jgi:hypothetical protein
MSLRLLSTRAAACALIALVVFPFSAPLSVCDLSDLVLKSARSLTAPLSNTSLRVSVVKDALAQPFPIRAKTRTRGAALLRRPSLVDSADQTPPSDRRTSTRSPRPARPSTKTILRI